MTNNPENSCGLRINYTVVLNANELFPFPIDPGNIGYAADADCSNCGFRDNTIFITDKPEAYAKDVLAGMISISVVRRCKLFKFLNSSEKK